MPPQSFVLYVVSLAALVGLQLVARLVVAKRSSPTAERIVDAVSAVSIGLFVYLFARHVFPALP
jgi:hypothetical protein